MPVKKVNYSLRGELNVVTDKILSYLELIDWDKKDKTLYFLRLEFEHRLKSMDAMVIKNKRNPEWLEYERYLRSCKTALTKLPNASNNNVHKIVDILL